MPIRRRGRGGGRHQLPSVLAPTQPQQRSRAYQLLDEATQLRSSWGTPNPILEPEKAIEYNDRLIAIYEETAQAGREEGKDDVVRISEGWIARIRETNDAIRTRVLAETAQQTFPFQQNAPSCGCSAPQPNPFDPNLAESNEIVPGVSGTPRVAEAELCDARQCEIAHLLVRGDYIEFVSEEQVSIVGSHPLDDRAMPSDIKLPRGYVLVHDATGTLLTPCDLYAVKWHRSGVKHAQNIAREDLRVAEDYFGGAEDLRVGSVDIPEGPWQSLGKVKFIRYRRYGFANHFEHEYNPSVDLFYSRRPLAWRLVLPEGCRVDSRGFVVP